MMKAARRKLKKLWSRKKKKKKSSLHNNNNNQYHHHQSTEYHLPPPPNYHYHYASCSSSLQIQPSAPPLPPWLEVQWPAAQPQPQLGSGFIESYSFLSQFDIKQQVEEEEEEEIEKNTVVYSAEAQQGKGNAYDAALYQKYMVPDPPPPPMMPAPPPVTQKTQMSSVAGMLGGCIVKLGHYLFRCFCPCFHIREAHC